LCGGAGGIAEGHEVSSVAQQWGVSRHSLHAWLGRYEAAGLEGLVDRSHRPGSCPHQMPALVEAAVLELRRVHGAGARRIVVELGPRGVAPLPSESGVYRALTRAGVIEPGARRRRRESWKRWERGTPMELWQVSTGRFGHPPTEVLFDRICRENGVEHLLTPPRSPTTAGKIERSHRSLRAGCLTGQLSGSLPAAQAAQAAQRAHQALDMATPAVRFGQPAAAPPVLVCRPQR
jgi:transposase-like protein